jgi:DNA end-binding protein Ku
LVSVPVSLYPANRTLRTSLRMLGPDGRPLARRYFAEKNERELDSDKIVRGYEIEKGKYVVVTDDELERLEPEKTQDISLTAFVPIESIPATHFERSYFLIPAGKSTKAYKLLAETMEKSGRAGIATFVMRGKEYLTAIFPDNGILRAETMRFADELRSPADIELPAKSKVSPATRKKLETLISGKSKAKLSTAKLSNDESARLMKLVNKKKKGKRSNVVKIKTPKTQPSNVIDIMRVLKRSLSGR